MQGYVELINGCKYDNLHNILGLEKSLHVESRKGTRDQAREYCLKSDTAIGGTQYEYGEWRKTSQGHRSDLDSLADDVQEGRSIREIAERNPGRFIRYGRGIRDLREVLSKRRLEKTEVLIIHEEKGNKGKTTFVMNYFDKDQKAYWHTNTKWWDGYDGEEMVIWDDFKWDELENKSLMLRLMDKTPLKLEKKGGFVNFTAKYLIITTNDNPNHWFADLPQLKRRIEWTCKWNGGLW
jgi:hypothetical protein